jgi:glycine betaine/proline transport system substrate-binding protein
MTTRTLSLRGLCAAAAVGALAWSAPASAADGELRIGLNNWAENVAVSNMWKILLEERGYDVTLVSAGKQVVYDGVARDNLDMGLEVWLPKTDKQFVDKYEDELTVRESWYSGTGLGLVVPTYVEDVDSITELPDTVDKFDGKIVGIDPGSALMGLTDTAVETYGLENYELISSSGPGMTSALKRAVRQEEPIVVTLWNPHWAFADFDLKYLDDPKNVYGEGEDIYWMSRKGFGEDHPQIVQWLNTWQMNDAQLGGLMAKINEVGDPAEGAEAWIESHRDLVESWMDGAEAAGESS